jgi:pimeloyl-ACP methyl ester carboxylesterase
MRRERAVSYLIREPATSRDAGAGTLAGPSARPPAGPSAGLFLTEPARGLAELAFLPLATPWLAAAPRGDGHGVLVLPGLLATDMSTVPLRQFLRWLGYDVRGWSLGRNVGPTDAVLDDLPPALTALAERSGGPVSVVGWSLGGIYARELARQLPGHVRQVITLGSPFALTDPRPSRADRAYQSRSYLHAAPGRVPTPEQVARPIAVPSTAVYSRRDGIVSWQACQAPQTSLHENVEVRCSHLGFGVDPATWWLIADRLAAAPGPRPPFTPPLLLRRLYPGRR